MRLQDHPSVVGNWPPNPGVNIVHDRGAPDSCLDILEGAFTLRLPGLGLPGIALTTVFGEAHYLRDLFFYDDGFTTTLCEFLGRQTGKTIRAIGELDVDF